MDFLPTPARDVPKMTYQCLAVITVGGAAQPRRGSQGSNHSDEGGGLARVISGGRRKSASGPGIVGGKNVEGAAGEGTWFWRARIGVTDDALLILPLSEPANPLLKARPPPLSHILSPNGTKKAAASGEEGLGAKFKNAMRRASAGFIHKPEAPVAPHDGGIPENAVEDTPASPPAAAAAAAGGGAEPEVSHNEATQDVDHTARETGWPAEVEGHPLQCITVPLHNLAKDSIHLGGNDKTSFHVSASIGSAIAGKAGHLRFEFDKDWVGGKGESELLYDRLSTAVAKAAPLFKTVQLGGISGGAGGATTNANPKNQGHDADYDPNWQGKVRGTW